MPHPQTNAAIERILKAMRQADQTGNQTVLLRQYEKYLKLRPEDVRARAEAASFYIKHGHKQQAAPHIEKALALSPDESVDRLLFPLLALETEYLNNLEQARNWYERSPNQWRLRLFVRALLTAEHFDEAEVLLCQYLEQPHPPELQDWLLIMLASCYYHLRRFYDSIACAQLILEKSPESKEALQQLARGHEQLGNYKQAFEYFQAILLKQPDDADTHLYLAALMLKLESFSEGWKHWEWRWEKALAKQVQNFPIPEWQGESLEGKILLVWAEQGIGDEIMFASTLPDLVTRGGTVHYECDKRLIPLLSRQYPSVNFIKNTYANVKKWPKADYHIPAGSLCRVFRTTSESFGTGSAYLSADANFSSQLREKYQSLFPGKRLVGISWRGGRLATNKYSRSLSLEDLARLGQLPDVQLINLQYGAVAEELKRVQEDFALTIHNDADIDPMIDIDAQAAQITALDAVISIDNTTVHLAGALGIKTYAILPLSPDWRWGLEQEKSYWYSSVNLVRNQQPDNWSGPIDLVIKDLQKD